MVYVVLVLLGLCFGSFINALIWRMHEQAKPKSKRVASDKDLSIATGRSMCTHCKHELGLWDLLPLVSWLLLRGKCRYCGKRIEDTPIPEAVLPVLFVLSYHFWPHNFDAVGNVAFGAWLAVLVMLVALLLYDVRWMLLPNRVVYPLTGLLAVHVLVQALVFGGGVQLLVSAALSVAIAGGIFYVLFQLSDGKWIGGGDVKLGFAIGLLLAHPGKAALMLFAASLLGLIFSLPLMLKGSLKPTSRIPFGPFLILAAIITYLFGGQVIDWYTQNLLFR